MIRDQIVYGTADVKLRERLLREDSLTLEKAVQLCKAAEIAVKQRKTWDSPGQTVEVVSKQRQSRQAGKCGRCNTKHDPKKCPAYGKECYKCKGRNHFATRCKTKVPVDSVHDVPEDHDFDVF
ncbi:unnamed protein product [Ixodes pacificus]